MIQQNHATPISKRIYSAVVLILLQKTDDERLRMEEKN